MSRYVYIAGPYTGDEERNVERALDSGARDAMKDLASALAIVPLVDEPAPASPGAGKGDGRGE